LNGFRPLRAREIDPLESLARCGAFQMRRAQVATRRASTEYGTHACAPPYRSARDFAGKAFSSTQRRVVVMISP
jgi:hypothetical protein